ncbi:7TM diverse intracellular signaling domain-containing protein [Limibacter armeniacum]|uniref:7TM diverse intracellular signaling domain-containing protein n=1 Tax=Limibacter armeniacum TaxID=466084 RepID=UPI002FE5B5A3
MNYPSVRALSLIVILLTSLLANGQSNSELTLDQNFDVIDPTPNISIYIDPENEKTIEDIATDSFDGFIPNTDTGILDLGFSTNIFWFKTDIINQDHTSINDWLLEIGYPSLDYLDIYLKDPDGNISSYQTGDRYNFSKRPLKHRHFLYPLDLRKEGKYSLFLRVQTEGPITLPLKIYRENKFVEVSTKKELGNGIFFGMMMLLCLYNIFLYFSIRDNSYLVYALPVIMSTLFYHSLEGHVFQYILYDYPAIANRVTLMVIGIWVIGSTWFTFKFLNPKKYAPATAILLYSMYGLGILNIISEPIFGYATATMIARVTAMPAGFSILFTGFTAWAKGHRYARFFTMAWFFYLIGIGIYVVKITNVVPANFWTENAMTIGNIIQVAFLSMALGDRYRIYREEHKHAIQERIRVEKEAKETLEAKVQERTEELAQRNEEILSQSEKLRQINLDMQEMNLELEQQNEEIAAQRDVVEENGKLIEEKNKKITASINYAHKIQKAILPSTEAVQEMLPQSFIFYKPKDIVSGDFYWLEDTGDKLIVAAVDCTGHGVPGALMSMLGDSFLRQAVTIKKETSPEKILDLLNKSVQEQLHKDGSLSRDGMDIAICVWDKEKKILEFAGAKNPLIYIKNQKVFRIKGDKFSIGNAEVGFQYSKHRIKVDTPTTFYIFSDGYADQFGGPEGRKLMNKRFLELLYVIHSKPMDEQEKVLADFVKKWSHSGSKPQSQIDDLLVVGFKLS